jgi:hypothetical protein
MISLTLAHTLRCGFDLSFMVDWITAVGREADYCQAWAHFEQRLAAEKETATS